MGGCEGTLVHAVQSFGSTGSTGTQLENLDPFCA